MKNVLSIVLILIMLMVFEYSVFAGDNIAAAAENVYDATYGDNEEIKGDEVPVEVSGTLPKTGGIPAELFYAVGVVLVGVALLISKKKTGARTKE